MKLFKINHLQIIIACQENFSLRLHSELIVSRTKKSESSHYLLEYEL